METAFQRRDRVTALVAARFPGTLAPNRFTNAILDIIRGGHGFDPDDRLEAIDALTERHLPASTTWGVELTTPPAHPEPPIPARQANGALAWEAIMEGATAVLDGPGHARDRLARTEEWLAQAGTSLAEFERVIGRAAT